MSMLQNRSSPNIPQAPAQYDVAYMNALSNVIRLFFNTINTVQQLNLASLNLDLRTLPTDADYVNLRLGDVYRDTEGGTLHEGTNVLRIKVPGSVVGVFASGAVGSVSFAEIFGLTGISGVGTVGTIGVTKTIELTGVSGAGAVGTVTP
jgi:hypothetical protein